jgi:tripartite-type tricarboxylate transporter receptor subunit TctC
MNDVRASLRNLGMDVIGNSPDEFTEVIRSEIPFWASVIRQVGITPE